MMNVRLSAGAMALGALMAASGCQQQKSPTTPTPPTNAINFTALGASDAIGYGSSNVCIPFTDCPNGMGYLQITARQLTATGKAVTFVNLGVPGAVLSPEIQQLGNAMGRGIVTNVVDNERPFVPADTTLLTLFIGGNDANTIGSAVENGRGGSDVNAYVQGQITAFGSSLRGLVSALKTKAPNAKIVVLNLPNMAALPYASGYSLAQKKMLQTIAVGLSAQMNDLASQGVSVLDLMCDGTFYQPSIFSSDGFHPNDAGYAHMANLVLAAANGATAAPRASCAQMNVY